MKKSMFLSISLITFLVFNILFTNISSAFSVKDNNTVIDFGDTSLFDKSIVIKEFNGNNVLFRYRLSTFSRDCYVTGSDNTLSYNGVRRDYIYEISTKKVSTGEFDYGTNFVLSSSLRSNDLVYSSFDICDKSGNLVFQKPVLNLAEALVVGEPVKTYQTMIHGMIISLIVFLVGLVAFWKGWQFLSQELHKA